MKKIVFFLSLMIVVSCKSQNKKDILPSVDNKFEKFDSNKIKDSDVLREFLSNGNYIEINAANSGKYYQETFKDSYYMISKSYYPNGNIKSKGAGFNGDGFQIGKWYEFDEKGNLIKEVDYDKPYKFTFEDILMFCEKEGISLTKGPVLQSTGFHTTIIRRVEKEKPVWVIEWRKKSNVLETITLDGTTGKVISRRDSEYINN
ncbi:toxin-antitoxin system YwqK family antitoxin [Chryseobacterium pennipullorum]|uniref:MORN repeat variant n=1 Tax=Chryseobacterium pennipullorum TaxID=2258963 RepID=A0A3D9AZY0_9FLAO|nr:hypothetical protein [Chryseobacterium pennipullorum]REC46839.1 hypothetical protein DRF67_13565 [Chryseobacterium pennipullorum]